MLTLALDIPVILPENDNLSFSQSHMGCGLQSGEVQLTDGPNDAPSLPEFNASAMEQLEGMGFPTIRCQKALLATGNSDSGDAMEWLFAHIDDPDIDSPLNLFAGGGNTPEPDPNQVALLADMGFTVLQARKALRETVSHFALTTRVITDDK